ncbi:MAG: hypothetical protein HOV66_17150 [Streptomycetaceae bacterium]|nr:hypothetical protein [Streptomycetaceae bacterium]
MTLSHDTWQLIMGILGSGEPDACGRAYTYMLAAAPRVWEPTPLPALATLMGESGGGKRDGDTPANVPGGPDVSPSLTPLVDGEATR